MNKATFLDIATAVAELRTISKTTREMSLSAINAKVITAHAGDFGRTFEPLTHYITRLCDDIDELANSMSTEALSLSRLSIAEMRLESEIKRFRKAEKMNPDIKACIQIATDDIKTRTDAFTQTKEEHHFNLSGIIHEVNKLYRQAKYINVNCRVEASHVPKERDKFNAVAEDMMASVDRIMETIDMFKETLIEAEGIEV